MNMVIVIMVNWSHLTSSHGDYRLGILLVTSFIAHNQRIQVHHCKFYSNMKCSKSFLFLHLYSNQGFKFSPTIRYDLGVAIWGYICKGVTPETDYSYIKWEREWKLTHCLDPSKNNIQPYCLALYNLHSMVCALSIG